MADLEKPSPFCQAKAWERKDSLNNPVPDEQQGFCQADKIEVWRLVPLGEREQIAKIVPDQAKQGIEWSMQHTLPQLQDKIVTAWNVKATNNGALVFHCWAACLQSRAKTY